MGGDGKRKKKEERVLIKRDRENANLNSKGNVCSPRRIWFNLIGRIYRKHLSILFFFFLNHYFDNLSRRIIYTFRYDVLPRLFFEESNIPFVRKHLYSQREIFEQFIRSNFHCAFRFIPKKKKIRIIFSIFRDACFDINWSQRWI